MSSDPHRPKGLLSLPNELVFIILDEFTSTSSLTNLLDIALCCRHLHFCAIQLFLARHGFSDPTSLPSVTLSRYSSVLSALRISLFPTSIRCLRYKFCQFQFHTEVRQLERVLSRLVRVNELILDFTYVDYWAVSFVIMGQAKLFLRNWMQRFEALIDTALVRKTCSVIQVWGGRVYPAASQSYGIVRPADATFRHDNIPTNSFIPSLRHTAIDPYREALGLPNLPVCKNSQLYSTLTRFHICSPMLFHPVHSFWTLRILNNSPITNLALMHIDIPSPSWEKLLSCITLLSLSTLSLAACNITSTTLCNFLSRHRRITTLSIGDGLPIAEDIPISQKTAFRHLVELTAPIDYLHELLCPPTNTVLLNLRYLSIHTSIRYLGQLARPNGLYTTYPSHLPDLIATVVRSRNADLSLTLVLPTESDAWLDTLVDEGYIGAGHVLRRIVHLVVSAPPTVLSPKMAAQFPVWLASFPGLHRVSFVGSPDVWEMSEIMAVLVRTVKTMCSSVECVLLSGVEYNVISFA